MYFKILKFPEIKNKSEQKYISIKPTSKFQTFEISKSLNISKFQKHNNYKQQHILKLYECSRRKPGWRFTAGS